MAGLVLAVQNVFNLFATATYTWALVAPGGVGLGLWLQAWSTSPPACASTGAQTLGAGFICSCSARSSSRASRTSAGSASAPRAAVLPLLFIVVGIVVMARRSLPSPAR